MMHTKEFLRDENHCKSGHTSQGCVMVVGIGVVAMAVPPMCFQLTGGHNQQPPRQQQEHRELLRSI